MSRLKKKKNYKKKRTDLEEDCSVCDEQETSATENYLQPNQS